MALADIRAQLKTTLEGVTGIGRVYDYLRRAIDKKGILALFKDSNGKLNTWQITRREVSEEIQNQNHTNIREHVFIIFGVLGHKDIDATEKTFQDLIELVCAALRTAGKSPQPLSNTALYVGPPQIVKIEHGMFGGVLAHGCEISLNVQEYIQF